VWLDALAQIGWLRHPILERIQHLTRHPPANPCYAANKTGYLLTPEDRICAFCDAECASDHEAKEQALKALGSHPAAEIWQGSRIVGRVLACELDAISGMPDAFADLVGPDH
jgi:hypothetical protein